MDTNGSVLALGSMSGTSLDGVDAAMLRTDGVKIEAFGDTKYRRYSGGEQATLRAALGRWPDEDLGQAPDVSLSAHVELLLTFQGAELVGFHGQTLAHDPQGRGTHQMGDGAALAQALGVPVVWDFRSDDVAKGGEGAPLAPFFHFACAAWIGTTVPLCFLNLGGVGNLTWIDPNKPAPEVDGALLAFDTGPANAPINDLMMQRRGLECDRDGALAACGTVLDSAVTKFLDHPFFRRSPPKSLDRDDFATALDLVRGLSDADAAATLTAMTAASVKRGMAQCPIPPDRVLVTGGGRRNPVMMRMLQDALSCPVIAVESVGLDGDMLEAQAFAHLAVRVARGLPTSAPSTTGVRVPVSGGVISTP
ncbi:anhydro-N-acetylmuramic acid kinase [Primorskyibacter flagellatus]|uniref:Anhydro-N-acetylmuramic acid kinase n=1 Tax=Primorskyibacter flagellatus TaxID=1387277 RepID=A0A1W1Z392_9RHOB|nr:anhydro-N-acetylmuramic acid kinase [Primorskyibacter flagellatus]SMC42947.1 anhydro-N-acetylmuramic acid kinase [Primorskyibacter flagellatus]